MVGKNKPSSSVTTEKQNMEEDTVITKDYIDSMFDKVLNRLDEINMNMSIQQTKVAILEKKVEVLQESVCELNHENEVLHRLIKKKNLVISGLDETDQESESDLSIVVTDFLVNDLKCNINCIDKCMRIGKKQLNRARPIKVMFTTHRERDEVWAKKSNAEPPIYINEDLPASIRKDQNVLRKKKREALANNQTVTVNWKERSIVIDGKKFKAKNGEILTSENVPNPLLFQFSGSSSQNNFLGNKSAEERMTKKRKVAKTYQ